MIEQPQFQIVLNHSSIPRVKRHEGQPPERKRKFLPKQSKGFVCPSEMERVD
jgi:hypothetical protein